MSSQFCVVCLGRQIYDPEESSFLEEHLRTIFLLRQLLQFPAKECEALMIEEEVAGRSGNPGAWCSLCEACVEVVRQAFELHREIAKAVKQVQRLVEGLKDKMKRSWDQEEMEAGGDSLMTSVGHRRIRKYFREKERECQAAVDEDVKVLSAEVEIEEEEKNSAFQISPDPLQSLRDLVETCEVAMNSGICPPVNNEQNLRKSRRARNTMKMITREDDENDVSDSNVDFQPVESDNSGSVSPSTKDPPLEQRRVGNRNRKFVMEEEERMSEEKPKILQSRRRSPRRKTDQSKRLPPKKVRTGVGRRRIYLNGSLNCVFCSFATEDRTEMYNHRKNHFVHDNYEAPSGEGGNDTVACKICSESVPSKRKYFHLKQKHLEVISDKVHLCHLCNQILSSDSNLRAHIRTVHKIKRLQADHRSLRCPPEEVGAGVGHQDIFKNGSLNCDRCTFVTDNKRGMYLHRKNHFIHDNYEPISGTCDDGSVTKCKLCSESVKSNRKYWHLKEKHLEIISDKVHLCHLCNQTFASGVNLRAHIRVVHEKKQLQCDQCEAQFSSKPRLLDHLERHKSGKNCFMCEFCGIEYRSRGTLLLHKKNIHNFGKVKVEGEAEKRRQRKCKHCDLVLAQDYELKLHIKEVHAELYQHKCDECDAMYLYRGGLVTHKQAQHSKEGVKCPHCDAEVRCRAYLAGHIRNWCKQKPQSLVGLPILPTEEEKVPRNKD